jgi:hypothetical protein
MFRTLSIALIGILGFSGVALAKKPTATFLQQRMVRLKQTARTLQQAGLPGYAVKYTRTGRSVRPEDRKGAMLVTAIDRSNVNTWNDKVGKHSVGFCTSAGANSTGSSSGYVRIGSEWMSYSWVRGGGTSSWNKEPITQHSAKLTEATFLVNGPELAAFKAFYYARNANLIKRSDGRPIKPGWVDPGKSNLKTEGCAGAASSGLSKSWVGYFKRNLAAIKAYGQQNNIPELANAPANAPQLLKSFIDRVGAKQQTDPRVLVRHHAPTSDMVTVFNQGFTTNPKQELKWNRKVQWYTSYNSGRRYRDRNNPNWTGMGYNHTMFDLAAGEKAKKSWKSSRMGLSDFANSSL